MKWTRVEENVLMRCELIWRLFSTRPDFALHDILKLSYNPHKDKYKSFSRLYFSYICTQFRETEDSVLRDIYGLDIKFTPHLFSVLPVKDPARKNYVCLCFFQLQSVLGGMAWKTHTTYDIASCYSLRYSYTNMSIPHAGKLMLTLMCSLHDIKNGEGEVRSSTFSFFPNSRLTT